MVAALRLEGSVRLHGRAEKSEYWEILRAADLAVQLRSGFNAGASGAVSDCIAAGVPVIVTGIGWSTELPPDVVLSGVGGVLSRWARGADGARNRRR